MVPVIPATDSSREGAPKKRSAIVLACSRRCGTGATRICDGRSGTTATGAGSHSTARAPLATACGAYLERARACRAPRGTREPGCAVLPSCVRSLTSMSRGGSANLPATGRDSAAAGGVAIIERTLPRARQQPVAHRRIGGTASSRNAPPTTPENTGAATSPRSYLPRRVRRSPPRRRDAGCWPARRRRKRPGNDPLHSTGRGFPGSAGLAGHRIARMIAALFAAAIRRNHGLEQVDQRTRHALVERAFTARRHVDPQEGNRPGHAIGRHGRVRMRQLQRRDRQPI